MFDELPGYVVVAAAVDVACGGEGGYVGAVGVEEAYCGEVFGLAVEGRDVAGGRDEDEGVFGVGEVGDVFGGEVGSVELVGVAVSGVVE